MSPDPRLTPGPDSPLWLTAMRDADKMFSMLVAEMNNAMNVDRTMRGTQSVEVPAWL